jgi:mersacidin/lichenicidin family type 2 lantibiotic
MSKVNIVRAWKDAEYRASLEAAEQAKVPAHPAGLIDLTGTEMSDVVGGDGGNGTGTHHGTGGNCTPNYTAVCSLRCNLTLTGGVYA